ncbi:MAG: S8 family peptidase [Prolixibacteraceae bacterium]|nr:S8 family peptidase [Prolixibacteraceae bacterium]
MRKYLIFILIFSFQAAFTQEPEGNIYWIQFNTKAGTPYSLNNPETLLSPRSLERRNRVGIQIDSTDLPVNPAFTDSLQALGFYIKHTSRWLNGAIGVFVPDIPVDSIIKPSFVDTFLLRRTTPLKSIRNKFDVTDSTIQNNLYGSALTQIAQLNGNKLHEYSKGNGAHVAVIDAGFLNADLIGQNSSLFENGQILGTHDFVTPGNDVFREHNHGTMVLSTMATNLPGEFTGTAPEASYWLLRSEDVYYEYPAEEDYWIVALEFADSVGCDVVNTSLGYTTFDNPKFNHTYSEFNGDSTRIAKAANLAVNKGMVLVCSAGNSGNDAWHYISAPSEAKNVLSVAAIDNAGEVTGFSSRGFGIAGLPPKPDIAAMGTGVSIINQNGVEQYASGTSFSSPIIAGMTACLTPLFPNCTAHEIIEAIRQSSNRFPEHSTEYGYGIPDFYKAYLLLRGTDNVNMQKIENVQVYPNPFANSLFIANTKGISEVKFYTFDGQLKYSTPLNQNAVNLKEITPENLPAGIYILILQGDQTKYAQKIVKQ